MPTIDTFEMGEIIEDKTLVYGEGEAAIKVLLLKQDIGLGLIGMISSSRFDQNVALVVNEGNPVGAEYGPAYHGSRLDGTGSRVGMDAALIDALRAESAEALTILFHELGHMVNHDTVAVGEAGERYNQDRMDAVAAGQVKQMELLADDFAAEYLGTQTVIDGLSSLLEREREAFSPEEYDPADIDVLLDEIRFRIKHQRRKLNADHDEKADC